MGVSGSINVGTVSGTDITFASAVAVESGGFEASAMSFDSTNNKILIAYNDVNDSNNGKGFVVTVGGTQINLTSENYIGMSSGGQVASGSSATVDILGTVNADQSSLTAGQSYFVQTDGTIGLTAGSPSVFAGTAISATELLVKA